VTTNTQSIVFIDSRVPDIQDLIDGVEPGVQVFVLDSGSDGVEQIADILAANDLHDLSSISIVSHGADGSVMLGTTTLSEGNLASYSRALAEIGSAVAPGGDIQLYGCDVALGSTGQQFINDFSTLAGGVTVAAATHIVGSADLGGSWTLDASSNGGGTPTVTSPFTSEALASFQGDLTSPGTGVLFYLTSGTQADQRIEDDVNNTTTSSVLFQETGGGVFNVGTPGPAIVIDTVADLYFVLSGNQLLEGHLDSTVDPTAVATWTSFFNTNLSTEVNNGDSEVDPGALAIDLTNHRLFIGVGSDNNAHNGFVGLTYSQTSGAVSNVSYVATMATSNTQPSSPEEMVYNNGTIYFIDNAAGGINENGVYRIDLGTGSFTQMVAQTQFPIFNGSSYPNGGLAGIALDPVHNRLYFSTRDANAVGTTQDAIWEVGTGASLATATKLSLPAGVTILEPDVLTYDRQLNVLYWANHDDLSATHHNNIVMAQLDATGTTITSVTTIDPGLDAVDPSGSPEIASLQFDELPTLSGLVGTAIQPTEEHGAVTLASGITITDVDNTSLSSATVFFGSGSFAGASDILATDTTGTSITASYNSSTETLTLSGIDSFAHYAQVLDKVTFTAGENPTNFGSTPTRVIDWIVSDGAPAVPFGNINSASSTITVVFVNDAPTLTSLTNANYTEEGSFATLSSGLSVVDVDDVRLLNATVQITGGTFAGDTDVLAANTTGTSITASYNTSTHTLLLTGSDTLPHYKTVLDSVTFHSGENPTNYGSNTTRTISWVVMDPSGTAIGGQDTSSVTLSTVTITNVNDAPTLALGTTVASWTEEGATTSLAPNATATDPDNLKLAGATVSISGGFFAGDVLAATGNGTIGVAYNSSTGTLTLSGTDTLANYVTVLDSVTYHGGENPTDFGSDLTRTLSWVLNDGGSSFNLSTAQTSTISVTFVNDAPTLSNVAGSAQYTEEGSAVTLSSGLSLSDPDDLNLSSATIQITGGTFAGDGDHLAANGISNGTFNNISVFYNSSSETLTLTGTDTLADYQFLLDRVTFSAAENPTNFGSNTTRTLTWVAQDPSGTLNGGSNTSSFSTTTVTITNVNDAPTLALGATTASWTEEPGTPTTLAPAASVTDPDSLNLASATVQITGGTFAGDADVLGFDTTGTSITASYNTSTETLTLSGTDTLGHYQSVLDSVSFHAGENPTNFGSNLTRTLTWTLNDGSASNATSSTVSTVSVTFINDAPTLSGVTPTVTGTPTQTVSLSPSVTISDPDDVLLKAATVSISGGTFAGDGDVLTAEGTTSGTIVQSGHTITIAYNSGSETLLLTGSDTLADYQNVLDTVAWHSTAGDPTNSGSNATRTISWTVQDIGLTLNGGVDTSTPQSETLIIDTPPTLSGLANASWTEETPATTLSPNVTISDPDGISSQLSATVQIVGGTFAGDSDVLAANTAGTSITASYNSSTETLTLTGSDSLAHYQTVLDSVTFVAGENPTNFGSNLTRSISWVVTDYIGTPSAPVTTTVSITNVNDQPTLSNVPASASFTEEGAAVTLAGAASVTDPDSLKLTGATVQISGGTFAGDGDVLAATAVGNITVSYNAALETLTFSGSDTLAHYQQVLDSLTFNDGENPTNFGSNPTRTVTWTLNDGSGSFNLSAPVTSTISITNVNDQPTLSNVAASANYTEEGAAATLSGAVSISDPDNLNLVGATVKITAGSFAGDADLLAANTGGTSITASYNSTTETLTLSGTDTLGHYQSVLDSVTFSAGENPTNFGSNPTRTVTWTLDDGSASNNLSTVVTSTVSITNVNDAPTLSNVPASANFTEEGPAVTLASGASVSDPDSLKLASATVKITGGTFVGDGDQLAVNVGGTSILGVYNPGTETLTLTGSDTLAHYQQVLDSLTFNAGENPNNFGSNPTRTVTWQLNDGSGSFSLSTAVTSTINIANVNDAPTLTNVPASANYTEEGAAVTLASAVTVTDPDDLNLSGATVKITGGTFAGDADVLAAVTTGTSITASYNSSTETLTLSGTDSLAHYQSVLDSVTFSAGENPNNYGSNPTRTLTWTVMDPGGTANGGVNVSTPVTSTVSITNVNDAPTLTNVATLVAFQPQHTITISPAISVSDPDNLKLANATVKITGGTFAGDGDVLAANVAGTSITASYNAATETLTLTGSDTLADYQQVLDSVTFSSGNNPSNGNLNRTRTVTWVINDGSASNSLSTAATTTISIGGNVRNDFDGDNKSDLLLQNVPFAGSPDVMVELLNGTTVASSGTITTPNGWTVEATGEFNHDNKADIILQTADGTPQIWLMNGTSVTSTVALPNSGTSWHVIATGDFNSDGNTDILWQNNDGAADIWLMNGTTLIGAAVLSPNPGSAWHVIGAGDVNGDGKSDILWQNNDGAVAIWEMNGTTPIGGAVLSPNPGPSWHAINLGDFNGDGKADILWQNADGAAAIWELNGTSLIGGGILSPNPGTSWRVMGPSDFNGDGLADIVWQNADGRPAIWDMNGTSIIGGGLLPNPGSTWHVKDDGPISDPAPPPALHLSTPDAANSVAMKSAPDGAAGPSPPFVGFGQLPMTPPDSGLPFAPGPGDPAWKLQLHS
jgi:Domain of unknown function (DUF4347)/FG-GAP-like repeat